MGVLWRDLRRGNFCGGLLAFQSQERESAPSFSTAWWGETEFKKSKKWRPSLSLHGNQQRWIEFSGNPVLPDEAHSVKTGTVFDLVLWQENMTSTGVPADLYYHDPNAQYVETALKWRMWNSWRPTNAIGYSVSVDGKNWDQDLKISLGRNDSSGWEDAINRPALKKIATGKYAMWYTGQQPSSGIGGWIGYAESMDGIVFERVRGE